MRVLFSVGLAAALVTSLSSPAAPSDWFVDNAASGAGSGTSWADAWPRLANIDWGAVKPGDRVLISGGNDTKVYPEPLVIGASGSAEGEDITICVGQEEGHRGRVVIEGDAHYGVAVRGHAYVTVTGQVEGSAERGMLIRNRQARGVLQDNGSHHIRYRYLEISESGQDTVSELNGIQIIFTSAADVSGEIAYCDIHDARQDGISVDLLEVVKASGYGLFAIHHNLIRNIHDDGISGGAGGLDIHHNEIRDRVAPLRGHPDAIQLYNSYYRVYNNLFTGFCDVESGNSVVYFEPNGGGQDNLTYQTDPSNYMVYNNIFFEDSVVSTSIDAIELGWSDARFTSISDVYLVNNTFLGSYNTAITMGWSGTILNEEDVRDFVIANNIFSNSTYGGAAVNLPIPQSAGGASVSIGSFGSGASIVVDYNCMFGAGADQIGQHGTYEAFKSSTGAQSHEVVSDPLLDPGFFPISAESPVVDVALDLSHLFRSDKEDIPRPQGPAWDLGAYELPIECADGSCIHVPSPDDGDESDGVGTEGGCDCRTGVGTISRIRAMFWMFVDLLRSN